MSTLGLMVDQKALVSLHSSLPMMLETPSNNSTAMIGKAVPSKSAKIALQALALDSEVVAVLALVEVSEAVSEAAAVDLELVEVLVEVSEVPVVEEVSAVATKVQVVLMAVLELLLLSRTLSQTLQLLALTEVRRSTFAM
jgi:hypothetical protein